MLDEFDELYLCKLDPNTCKYKVYKEIPDLDKDSIFIVLNNDVDEKKYENAVQIVVMRADDKEETSNKKKKKVT